jgi:glutamyl-tRNA synthetase
VIAAAGDRIKTTGDILMFSEFFVADDALRRPGLRQAAQGAWRGARCRFRGTPRGRRNVRAGRARERAQGVRGGARAQVGQLIHPLRLAVTGRTVGLGLYDALAILGRERSLARIKRAIAAAG